MYCVFFFFNQKTSYEMRISDWSSDVCSSDLERRCRPATARWSTARRGFHRVPSDNLLQGIQELERFEGLGPLPVPIAGSGKAAREIDPVEQSAGEPSPPDRQQPRPDDVADRVRTARPRGRALPVAEERPRRDLTPGAQVPPTLRERRSYASGNSGAQ